MLADAISCNNLAVFFTVIQSLSHSGNYLRRLGEAINERTTRLDVSILVPTVCKLFLAGIAKST